MRYNKQFSATAIIIITMPLASVCARASDLDSESAALTALQAKADQPRPETDALSTLNLSVNWRIASTNKSN